MKSDDLLAHADKKPAFVTPEIQEFSEKDLREMFPEVFTASFYSDIWNSIAN